MKNRYEALLILNTQGREDSVKDIVDRLESEFQKEGAEIEQVQKMDKRQFSYVAGPLDSGFYVNFVFHADPQLVDKAALEIQARPGSLSAALPATARERKRRRKNQGKSWRARNKSDKTERWPVLTKSFSSEISPETRKCATRQRAARFAISACGQSRLHDRGGEKREEVTYVDVVLWARLAEIAGEYLKKGRPVFIEGRLQMDTWDDKQSGQKRTKLRVIGETHAAPGQPPCGGRRPVGSRRGRRSTSALGRKIAFAAA